MMVTVMMPCNCEDADADPISTSEAADAHDAADNDRGPNADGTADRHGRKT